MLIQSPECDSHPVFPAGLEVGGKVTVVRRVGLGFAHDSASLEIRFAELVTAAGEVLPIAADVVEIDNARATARNGLFLGSQQRIHEAFAAAGCLPADRNSPVAFFKEFAAFLTFSNYSTMPITHQLLNGQPQEMTWQKSFSSYGKREHIRLWSQPTTVLGRPAWLGAYTRETSAALSVRNHKFIHHIDRNLDDGVNMLVRDLFSHRVRGHRRSASPPPNEPDLSQFHRRRNAYRRQLDRSPPEESQPAHAGIFPRESADPHPSALPVGALFPHPGFALEERRRSRQYHLQRLRPHTSGLSLVASRPRSRHWLRQSANVSRLSRHAPSANHARRLRFLPAPVAPID